MFIKYGRFNQRLTPFYEGDGGGGGGEPNNDPNPNNPDPNDEPKFSQNQLNSIVNNDKKKVQAALYKELGFENGEDAKAFIDKYKEHEDKNKSELEKANATNTALESELKANKDKAEKLENKFKAIELGCNPEHAEEVVLLASAKVDDTKDFATALNEVKEKFPSMFTPNGGSTGGAGTPPRGKTHEQVGDLGKRLAEANSQNRPKKDEFFTGKQ